MSAQVKNLNDNLVRELAQILNFFLSLHQILNSRFGNMKVLGNALGMVLIQWQSSKHTFWHQRIIVCWFRSHNSCRHTILTHQGFFFLSPFVWLPNYHSAVFIWLAFKWLKSGHSRIVMTKIGSLYKLSCVIQINICCCCYWCD